MAPTLVMCGNSRTLKRDEVSLNRFGIPKSVRFLIHHAGWDGGQHGWASLTLWIFASVLWRRLRGGMSRNQAAKQFGVAISTAIGWMRRVRETGSVAPGKMGGHKPKAISGEHRSGCRSGSSRRFHLARAGCRACRARTEGRLPLGVGVRPCREAQLQKKAWWLANAIVPTWRGGEPSGQSIKIASNLSVWSSSTRPGPGPIWLHCGDGRRAATG